MAHLRARFRRLRRRHRRPRRRHRRPRRRHPNTQACAERPVPNLIECRPNPLKSELEDDADAEEQDESDTQEGDKDLLLAHPCIRHLLHKLFH